MNDDNFYIMKKSHTKTNTKRPKINQSIYKPYISIYAIFYIINKL